MIENDDMVLVKRSVLATLLVAAAIDMREDFRDFDIAIMVGVGGVSAQPFHGEITADEFESAIQAAGIDRVIAAMLRDPVADTRSMTGL